MLGNTLQSAGRRFLRTFAFALIQASLFGSAIGLLVYFRPSRAMLADEERLQVHYWLGEKLERLERGLYDWRIRELGRASRRADQAVVVAIDDETMARARQAGQAELAMDPWPRELLGGMVDQLLHEGAELVLVDLLFRGLSPRACGGIDPARLEGDAAGPPPAPASAAGRCNDDEVFRRLLDRWPGRTVLAYDWGGAQVTSSGELRTTLVQVGVRDSEEQAADLVQRVLAERLPAFVLPQRPPSRGWAVWAGTENEEEARSLGQRWGVRFPLHVRDFTPRDQQYQVTPLVHFARLAQIEVHGVDLEALPTVKAVDHPVTPLLSRRSLYGATHVRPDGDGVVRAFPHLIQLVDAREGRRYVLPSMPLAAAMRKANVREVRYQDGALHVGPYRIPTDPAGYALLRFDADEVTSPERGSLRVSIRAWQVLVNLADRLKAVPHHYRHDLKGKVVVLANTTQDAGQLRQTPIGVASAGAVLGQAVSNLLGSSGITRVQARTDAALTVGLAFAGAFLALTFGRAFRSAGGVVLYLLGLGAAVAAFVWVARHYFVHEQLWLAMAGPLVAMHITFALATLHALRTELEVKEFVTSVLGRYVSTEVVHQVMRNVAQIRPERVEVTVYFSDIEGFTRFAEKLSPDQMVKLLNEYLSEMTEVVRRNRGYVDKYIGDAVMAFWGGLPRTAQHARLACESALQMRAQLARRQPEWERRYGYRVVFRAGINSGEVVMGDMGSELKSNFTVMGEAVDFAARLEPTNKQYGTYLLAGERTVQLARGEFIFREVDLIRQRDTTVPRRIYELLGRVAELTPALSAQLQRYDEALTHYRAQRFAEAAEGFEHCVNQWDDPVARVHLERARQLVQAPPGADWDGVYERRRSAG